MPKNLHDLVISQIRFFDIIKSIFFLIKKSGWLVISQTDEMMTPVFYLCYFFYILTDTKFRACTFIIIGSYHYSKELKGKNDSWYHTIDFFISQNHNDLILQNQFSITQNQFFDITNSILW